MTKWCRTLVVLLFAAGLLCACSSPPSAGLPVPPVESPTGGVNAPEQMDKPYLVLVSIDGFRWDYPDLGLTPILSQIEREGVRAERLLPVFPTLTFPNHYSLVTGLYPARHGVVANDFPIEGGDHWYHIWDRAAVENGRYYRGEPLWVTAETQGMVAASFFWVGSEADVMGVRPSHWRPFSKDVPGTERVDQLLAWLAEPAETRPHFYTLYFEEVDNYGHWYGPASEQARQAIQRVDGYLGRLLSGLESLPHAGQINLVIVSDHGQGGYLPSAKPLVLDSLISLDGVTPVDGGSYLFLYLDAPDPLRAARMRDHINQHWQHGQAMMLEDVPALWQLTEDPRFPDLILMADAGHGVISSSEMREIINAGDHGWRPEDPDMHGIFLARGPAFRQGARIGPVRNVDLHPLLVRLLGLSPPAISDGDPEALNEALR